MAQSAIVLGKGVLAIRIAQWFLESRNYDLVLVVPVVPEPTWTDSFTGWAKTMGISVVGSGDYRDIACVKEKNWKVDLAFSAFYDKIFRPWFIARCGRILNLHNGPLPRYRGVSPINWALKNGETKHGVTVHDVTTGVDEGPIVAQLEYSIYPEFDEVIDVYTRSLEYAWVLFKQTMPLLEKIQPRPQDHTLATCYSSDQNILLGERKGFTRLMD